MKDKLRATIDQLTAEAQRYLNMHWEAVGKIEAFESVLKELEGTGVEEIALATEDASS